MRLISQLILTAILVTAFTAAFAADLAASFTAAHTAVLAAGFTAALGENINYLAFIYYRW